MPVMSALHRFVDWMAGHTFIDRNHRLPPGLSLQYHSRSDEHSKKLGELIVEDLLESCAILREHAARGDINFGINHPFVWPNGKAKTLDLAIGIPEVRGEPPGSGLMNQLPRKQRLSRLLISCEEKALMTEHNKSLPRIYSELNDSHTIVHQGSRDTIAAGITMLNIAGTFVSPLRQRIDKPVEITRHNQPFVTARAVQHLRKLPLREDRDSVGLDAYCTFIVDADNQGHVALHTGPPAPQFGDIDAYETFLERICRLYAERFHELRSLPTTAGLSLEESLVALAEEHPSLLDQAAELAVREGLEGAEELRSIVRSLGQQPPQSDSE